MKFFNKITILFLGFGLFLSVIGLTAIFLSRLSIFILVIIPLISLIIGYRLSQSTLKQLIHLNQETDVLLSGNYDYQVATKTKDLIGKISGKIQTIANSLNKTLAERDQLYEEIEQLKTGMNDLDAMGNYFHTLFNSSNHGIILHTFDGKIKDVNRRACQMLGYLKDDFMKRSFYDLQPKEELTKSKKANKLDSHTCSVRYETIFEREDGKKINVEISSNVVDMKKNLVQSLISDITDQKQMIQALELSEDKFRSFMETANDLMFMTDKEGRFTYINQAMRRILNFSKDKNIQPNLMDIIHEESKQDRPSITDFLLPNVNDILEVVWINQTNSQLVGEMKTIGIFDNEGNFQGLRGVFRDITERKKIEEAQRLTQLGKLAADVAHELKNQLTVLFSLAELSLMDNTQLPEMRENIQSIYDQCIHLRDVVKRLLMFSKPSDSHYRTMDIHQVIDFTIKLIDKRLMKDQIRIQKKYNPEIPNVEIDEKQIQEVLINLIQNAAEAIEKEGRIEIRTSEENDLVRVDIEDTGSGISEENIKQIFNPFFTTKENGTGLGVSACYGIIKAHNGDLKYQSRVDSGTTVSILLPAHNDLTS